MASRVPILKLMTSFTHLSHQNAFFTSWVFAFLLLFYWQKHYRIHLVYLPPREVPNLRPHVFNLTDFGAVGDGKTINTKCFEDAVAAVEAVTEEGGAQIIVGPGRWLTAPFNVTSRMTLFLSQGATIVAIQVNHLRKLTTSLVVGRDILEVLCRDIHTNEEV